MTTLCSICQTPYFSVDGKLVCQEGHVSLFYEHDEDPETILIGSRINNTLGKDSLSENRSDMTIKMLLKLYYILKRKLRFTSDDSFKIFINYLDSKQRHLSTLRGSELRIVLYISLRKHVEGEGGILTYREFCKRFDEISYGYLITSCAREIANLKSSNFLIQHFKIRCHEQSLDDDLIYMYKTLNSFDFYHYISHIRHVGSTMSLSKLQKYFDDLIKSAIPVVTFIGREKEIIFKYFIHFVKIFHIRSTIKLVNDFRWFWEISDHPNDVFIPEIRIIPFLYIYARNNPTEIDIEANFATLYPKETSHKRCIAGFTKFSVEENDTNFFEPSIEDMCVEPHLIQDDFEKMLMMIFSSKSQIRPRDFKKLVSDNIRKLYVHLKAI